MCDCIEKVRAALIAEQERQAFMDRHVVADLCESLLARLTTPPAEAARGEAMANAIVCPRSDGGYDVIRDGVELRSNSKWTKADFEFRRGTFPTESAARAALAAASPPGQPAAEPEFDAEKASRIRWQTMCYDAMNLLDKATNKRVTRGEGCTVDSFLPRLQEALAGLAAREQPEVKACKSCHGRGITTIGPHIGDWCEACEGIGSVPAPKEVR